MVDAVDGAKNHECIMNDGAQFKPVVDDVDGGKPHDLGAISLHREV